MERKNIKIIEKYRKNNVCLVNNVHGLLIYLIVFSDKIDDTIYIIGDELDYVISLSSDRKIVFNIPKKKNIVFTKLIKYCYYYYLCQPFLRFILKRKLFAGQDHLYFSNVMNKSALVIEDGERTYFSNPGVASKLHRILFPIRFKTFHGRESFTKKILLTNSKKIPEELEMKGVIIDLVMLWKNISLSKKEQILKVFGIDNKLIKEMLGFKGADLLLTQPFSEEEFITEDEKIEIYNSLIKKHNLKRLIIKPHPREKTTYKFNDIEFVQLPNHFPSQFFSFFDICFERALTINSTAIYGIKAKKTIIEGVSDKKLKAVLLKKFVIDDLTKNNNQVDE